MLQPTAPADIEAPAPVRRARLRLLGVSLVAASAGGAVAIMSMNGTDSPKASTDAKRSRPDASASGPTGPAKKFTPATAPRFRIDRPKTVRNGMGVGFPEGGAGAVSAAVTYWQDLNILDDRAARRQLETITSRDSPQSVDSGLSNVHQAREALGLPTTGMSALWGGTHIAV
ncbi:hypothetical protein J7I98_11710 [Streptomyces sp. ISL-98]|uniref:hypothetical protein n=1 Tax=Streptomyces sp. ISL-98 TaxID=2819192 RepID=UPI001BE97510|nr:hypothetical protein [Streptomyces sp. ISL-98]MBT2506550.1 hypothetical protein [Streptomyces sp. ISL-98]